MYLKNLTINGFKSFARKSELEFSTAITGIVGPNGSGKSNVAEAFRFVLGEQSIKSMRGKKGEDLIFNGSQSVSRTNRASVVIVLHNPLQNGKRVFPLDFDEITVERAVFRDGTNEYSINGSRTRYKDVQELLASANIGPTGHHIISQGEADRILTAHPRERREMIEDALGLKVFQFKKAESERKLKKTQENIAHVESLRREVAPHLRFLEKQVKKIERARLLREELRGMYIEYLKREDVYLAHHQDRIKEAFLGPNARLLETTRKIEEIKILLEKSAPQGVSPEIVELETRMSTVRKERQEYVRAIGHIEGQISFINRQMSEHERRAHTVDETPIPRAVVQESIVSIENIDLASFQEENGLSRLRAKVVSLLSEILLSTHHAPSSDVQEQYTKERDALLEKKHEEESVITKLEEDERVLFESYNALKTRIESEHVVNRDLEREMFAHIQEQKKYENEREALEREYTFLEREREDFKRELQEAVTLIGRDVMAYFELELRSDTGSVLSADDIVAEDRMVQRERYRTLERMKIRLEELGLGAGEDVVKEYNEVRERDAFLAHEIDDLRTSVEKLEALILELTNELNEQFVAGIEKISVEFQTFFGLMFGGGTAELVRVKPKKTATKDTDEEGERDSDDEEVIEEGIEITVKLPNKRVSGLSMLSGGERALTSIALIFAMSQVNPPLFVILDETDAALDEANSRRYGDMITALSQKSQLILITHNRETMGRAGVLYGVTMAGDGVSKLLSVKFEEAVAVAK